MSALADAIEQLRANDEQWEAFNEDGHCAVLAPPGSGKTQLLTTKVADAVATELVKMPRGLACITMTNEAVLELRRRFRTLGVQLRANQFVGTVHSFALSRIVAPFAAAAGDAQLANARFATDVESKAAFDSAFAEMAFAPSEYGEVRLTTEKARQRLDLSGNRLLGGERIAETARKMQSRLEAQGVYDMNDLVRRAVGLVEAHAWIRRVLAATYPRIYVDEYQDLAPGLDRIVRGVTLAEGAGSTLFAVGDPDQAIYAFTGAHPELLRDLADDTAVRRIELRRNYRCAEQIIAVSIRALGESRDISGEREGGAVLLYEVQGGESAQAAQALELVRASAAAGTAYDQIAIIAPWSKDRDLAAEVLREAGVPVYARTNSGWKTTTLTMLIEIMASWASTRDEAQVPLYQILDAVRGIVPGAQEPATIKQITRVILDSAPAESASDFLEALVVSGIGRFFEDREGSEDARELARMQKALADGSAVGMTIAELGSRARAPGHVMATTIHGAKGLEFDVVILVGVDEGGLPGFNATAEQRAEGRRKFYVSITRAREHVHLVRTDSRLSKAGKVYATKSCPFVAELGLD